MSEQTANLCTTNAAESLRAVVAERDREIERLKEGQSILILARDEQKRLANEYRDLWSRAAVKSQPSGVVDAQRLLDWNRAQPEPRPIAIGREYQVAEACARLNSSPVSAGDDEFCDGNCTRLDHHPSCARAAGQSVSTGGVDERAAFQEWYATPEAFKAGDSNGWSGIAWAAWQKRAALSAPSHGEQVREGWQLVPVEPTDAMLEAGDKYIGTPATYKAMLSACPSPAITKDFSQFLSAVMDAAGLIRHGRQSKELSEYLGMKCMEYRGVAPSAGSHNEQGGE